MANTSQEPVIGAECTVHGVPCRIVRLHAAGTVDVEALDGSGRFWRVSGLALVVTVARCGCGAAYDERAWGTLTLAGIQDAFTDPPSSFELRNCPCGSTIARLDVES